MPIGKKLPCFLSCSLRQAGSVAAVYREYKVYILSQSIFCHTTFRQHIVLVDATPAALRAASRCLEANACCQPAMANNCKLCGMLGIKAGNKPALQQATAKKMPADGYTQEHRCTRCCRPAAALPTEEMP